jgi:hypothetical protein
MPIVISAWTGKEMLIDEPGGVAYITLANGDIVEVAETQEEALAMVQEQTPIEGEPTPEEGV